LKKLKPTEPQYFKKKFYLNTNIYLIAVLIKKVAAKATIAYNSGNTANIKELPNTSYPEAIPDIPFAQT